MLLVYFRPHRTFRETDSLIPRNSPLSLIHSFLNHLKRSAVHTHIFPQRRTGCHVFRLRPRHARTVTVVDVDVVVVVAAATAALTALYCRLDTAHVVAAPHHDVRLGDQRLGRCKCSMWADKRHRVLVVDARCAHSHSPGGAAGHH